MPSSSVQPPTVRSLRLGFTLIEAVMVILIIATVVGALTPSVIRQITHARTNRAASVIASDFYLAQATASRSRKPVLLTVDTTAKTVTLTDAQSSTQLVVRRFGPTSEFKLQRLEATPATVLMFPSGMASGSVAIVLGDASYTRNINVSRAGQIRIQ
jgi:type II secretory pathway pseudopilin PulG